MGKLANIPKFTPRFWKKVGDEICDLIRDRTQNMGLDVKGKKFKPYKTHAPFWFTKKVNGKTIRVYAEDYPTRKPKLRRGSGSNKVNLTLTGDMMNGLQVRGKPTETSVTIGWSGVNAQKIQWNADMGRAVTTKRNPIPKQAISLVQNMTGKEIKINAEKETAKPINFKIGR